MKGGTECPHVERIAGKVSGSWLFTGTRVPVTALFENLEDGATVDEFLGNELDPRFNGFVPCTQPLRAESREIAKRFVAAIARGDQVPPVIGSAIADLP